MFPFAGRDPHGGYQGSLLALGPAAIDPSVPIERVALDDHSWVDVARSWLTGSDELFHDLVESLAWRQRRDVPMYDRLVDEPRLTWWWQADGGSVEPRPVLASIRHDLSTRYDVAFDSIGCNLYRDGSDSVAWHGDRHRHHVVDPVVAIVSLGGRRPLRLRPVGGGAGHSWELGEGDLFVMGGACQHDWQHSVPKIRHAAPRLSVTYRHGAQWRVSATPPR